MCPSFVRRNSQTWTCSRMRTTAGAGSWRRGWNWRCADWWDGGRFAYWSLRFHAGSSGLDAGSCLRASARGDNSQVMPSLSTSSSEAGVVFDISNLPRRLPSYLHPATSLWGWHGEQRRWCCCWPPKTEMWYCERQNERNFRRNRGALLSRMEGLVCTLRLSMLTRILLAISLSASTLEA